MSDVPENQGSPSLFDRLIAHPLLESCALFNDGGQIVAQSPTTWLEGDTGQQLLDAVRDACRGLQLGAPIEILLQGQSALLLRRLPDGGFIGVSGGMSTTLPVLRAVVDEAIQTTPR